MNEIILLSDAEVAKKLSVSKSCIRGQRFKRRHGKPHFLTVDPVTIGKCPRYRLQDIEAWLASLNPAASPSQKGAIA